MMVLCGTQACSESKWIRLTLLLDAANSATPGTAKEERRELNGAEDKGQRGVQGGSDLTLFRPEVWRGSVQLLTAQQRRLEIITWQGEEQY